MPYYSGSFLVAKSTLKDPSFVRTVVLLLKHEADGAFGLVVNRPAAAEELPFPVFVGGPCESEGMLMLHGQSEWAHHSEDDSPKAVAPGIFIGDAECLTRVTLANEGHEYRYRVFVGYAGWGPGQLEGELASGDWAVVAANGNTLFDTPADEIWQQLLPPAIPQPSDN